MRPSPLSVLRRASRVTGLALVALSFLGLLVLGVGPLTGRYRVLTVLSASMRPTIPEGSVVIVTPMPLSKIRVGDVITYSIPVEDRRVVTHRVVDVVEAGPVLRTQGDANPAPDPWLARLGGGRAWRARLAVPRLGHAVHLLRRPEVRGLFLRIVLLLLALVWLAEIWRPTGRGRRPVAPVPGGPAVPPPATGHVHAASPGPGGRPFRSRATSGSRRWGRGVSLRRSRPAST